MTSANRPENATDDGNQENVLPQTAQELLPATVTFKQTPEPSVATNFQTSLAGPPAARTDADRSRGRRRIATIVGGIGGLLLLCAAVALMIGDRKGKAPIEAPDANPSPNVQEQQGAESSPQILDVSPVVIAEPPAFEDWLKGRTILTVAQNGSGQFPSIQTALNALQPGQVVEVLDPGPYQERLSLASVPADVGLISRVQTRVEFASSEWESAGGDVLIGHRLYGLNQFRIHGFEFVIPDNPQAGKHDVAGFHIIDAKGVVFENCGVHRTGADSFLVLGNTHQAAALPHVIRECDLEVLLQGYSHQPESELLVLRNHLSVSLGLHGLFKLCVIRHNIFTGAYFVSEVIHADTYDCSNNTFLNRGEAIRVNTREMVAGYERGQRALRGEQDLHPVIERGRAPTGHGVIFNNLHRRVGFLNVIGGGEQDPWPWEIGYNCFPGDGNIPAENALPRPANTLALPILYSVKRQDPNFARLKPDSPGAKSGTGEPGPITREHSPRAPRRKKETGSRGCSRAGSTDHRRHPMEPVSPRTQRIPGWRSGNRDLTTGSRRSQSCRRRYSPNVSPGNLWN